MKHVNIPIFIPQLGCPHQCIFCNQKKISAQTAIPTAKQVQDYIREYLRKIGNLPCEVEIAYFGGSFTGLPIEQQRTYLEAARPFLHHPLVTGIRISTRPDYIDEAGLDFLSEKGVVTIELGVQSFVDCVLQASGRLYTAQQAVQACKMIKAKQIRLGIQAMVGLPEDNYQHAMATAETIASLRPDMVRIYPTLVIKDTPLERMFYQRTYRPLFLPEAVEICADMRNLICRQGIRIIRMGLQPNEELRGGNVVAGPFHPAFGELVEQANFYRLANCLLEAHRTDYGLQTHLEVVVNPRDISKMIGYKRENITKLSQIWQVELTVVGRESQKPGEIEIEARKSSPCRGSGRKMEKGFLTPGV